MELDGSAIRAAVGMHNGSLFFSVGRKYRLARVNLVKAGLPKEILSDSRYARLHQNPAMPIVIEKNRKQLGFVEATRYFPSAVIVCGTARRTRLLSEGNVRGWAWVENGALNIHCDDVISSQELMDKLQGLLVERHVKPKLSLIAASPIILALYPFESYCVFSLGGQKFRQGYILQPIERNVVLTGQSQPVKEQYVNSDAGRDICAETCRRWSNPKEAVTMFSNDVLHERFRPNKSVTDVPQLSGDIFQLLASEEIGYQSFVRWSMIEQSDLSYKMIDGVKLARSKFRAIDKFDKSTWAPIVRVGRHIE